MHQAKISTFFKKSGPPVRKVEKHTNPFYPVAASQPAFRAETDEGWAGGRRAGRKSGEAFAVPT